MTPEELKIRQMTNQHLLKSADRMTVLRDLCGVQAQFMSNALHSLRIRCLDHNVTDGLVKNWTIRGTIHVLADGDLPLFLGFTNGDRYRSTDWTIPSFWNQRADWALTPQRQAELSECILDALRHRPHTREELKGICRERGMTPAEEASMFHPWGGGIRELCERGFMHGLVQEEKVYTLSPKYDPVDQEMAGLELARRYFSHIAPATIHDTMYFFRVSAAQVKKWLNQLPVCSAECGGRTYYYIENDEAYRSEIPRCLFLAGFDQLMLGYEKKESLYLRPEHMRAIFNLAGIVMPAVLLDGRVAGRWKKKNRRVSVELFEKTDKREEEIIREAAEALWGGEITEVGVEK